MPVAESTIQGEILKVDEDRRMVFGWASIVADGDGEELVDKQGDILDLPSLEDAVYDFMLTSRATDEMHQKDFTGRVFESVLFTPEKIAAMGLEKGAVPIGWWIGSKIDDDETWEGVKSGRLSMFSIRGRGDRTPILA